MRKTLFLTTAILALISAGCDKQRDLYDTSSSMLHVKSMWRASLGRRQMLEATAMFYKEDGEPAKEFFSQPNSVTTKISCGYYDILLFNGVMESEEKSNLDNIFFRGTDRLETFEAVAAEGTAHRYLSCVEGEYIASNEMEMLAIAHERIFVEGDSGYLLKYENGRNNHPVAEDYVEQELELGTRTVSFHFQIKLVNLINPLSARSAAGALRGFAGSVFLGPDMPATGFLATHHLTLTPPAGNNRVRTNPEGQEEVGTLQSPVFVTFGPPLPERPDQPETFGKYTFELCFLLTDNTEFKLKAPIDITQQVNAAMEKISLHYSGEQAITIDENLFTIEITDRVELPVIDPGKVVDITDWEDDEEIIVWIK